MTISCVRDQNYFTNTLYEINQIIKQFRVTFKRSLSVKIICHPEEIARSMNHRFDNESYRRRRFRYSKFVKILHFFAHVVYMSNQTGGQLRDFQSDRIRSQTWSLNPIILHLSRAHGATKYLIIQVIVDNYRYNQTASFNLVRLSSRSNK